MLMCVTGALWRICAQVTCLGTVVKGVGRQNRKAQLVQPEPRKAEEAKQVLDNLVLLYLLRIVTFFIQLI